MTVVVDQALEVVDAYQGEILKLERDILIKPNMKAIRRRTCFAFSAVVLTLVPSCSPHPLRRPDLPQKNPRANQVGHLRFETIRSRSGGGAC